MELEFAAILTGVVKVVDVDRLDLVNGWEGQHGRGAGRSSNALPGSGRATHYHRLRAVTLCLVACEEPLFAPAKDEEDMARRAWPADLSIDDDGDASRVWKFGGTKGDGSMHFSGEALSIRTADRTCVVSPHPDE